MAGRTKVGGQGKAVNATEGPSKIRITIKIVTRRKHHTTRHCRCHCHSGRAGTTTTRRPESRSWMDVDPHTAGTPGYIRDPGRHRARHAGNPPSGRPPVEHGVPASSQRPGHLRRRSGRWLDRVGPEAAWRVEGRRTRKSDNAHDRGSCRRASSDGRGRRRNFSAVERVERVGGLTRGLVWVMADESHGARPNSIELWTRDSRPARGAPTGTIPRPTLGLGHAAGPRSRG